MSRSLSSSSSRSAAALMTSERPSRSKRVSRRRIPGGKGCDKVMEGCAVPGRLQRGLKPWGRAGYPPKAGGRSNQAAIVEIPRFWYNTARGIDMPFEESDKALVERLKAGDAI